MINLSTNIFNDLTAAHKIKIQEEFGKLFGLVTEVGFFDYEEVDDKSKPDFKFFIGGIPLEGVIDDVHKWDLFVVILKKIFIFSRMDVQDLGELQFWISTVLLPLPINIFFSIKSQDELLDITPSLKDTLVISDVFNAKNIEKNSILILGYDKEGNAWRMTYL